MMTSFTRIIIVLSILRHALGLQQTPPNQVLIGLSLFLSLFVMAPSIEQINEQAIAPYSSDQITLTDAIDKSGKIMHSFMAKQTRQSDIKLFMELSNQKGFESSADIPFSIMLPAFVTSELKTAFQIGFLIFLPFLIIDLVVAAVLMARGMMMLSPVIISMPFKLLLFVLVDAWALTMGSLAASFATSTMTDTAGCSAGIAPQALWVTAPAAAPMLIAALLIGLLLGMVQAAPSMSEQTLTFVPKLVVVAVMLAISGGSILILIADF